MFKAITIIGDGAMGSVCAMLLCEKGLRVRMWGHDADQLDQICRARENIKFLPGYPLPAGLIYEADDARALAEADLIVSAVPCQFTRGVWTRLKPHVPEGMPIVSVTKGIEKKTLLRPTEIIADCIGDNNPLAALSGPTIADELARKLPASVTAACPDEALARAIQETFTCDYFRVYRNTDLAGVELAGASKNVIAIAAGIIDGIQSGDNSKAALVCRGLAELERLGAKLGADPHTFSGLSGLGDLITTCVSPRGRNRTFGEQVGRGMSPREALASTKSVVEGVATCESLLELAGRHGVEMPICEAVHSIIIDGRSVQDVLHDLMTRRLRAE